jgi:hypothetical protein
MVTRKRDQEKFRERRQRVYTFMKTPRELEKVLNQYFHVFLEVRKCCLGQSAKSKIPYHLIIYKIAIECQIFLSKNSKKIKIYLVSC